MIQKNVFKILLTVFVLISNVGLAQNVEVEIKTSAQCMECKENIESALIDQKGVKYADLNLESSIVKVVYNERKTSPEIIKKTITMVGYNADEMAADPEAVERLSPCCQPDGIHIHEE